LEGQSTGNVPEATYQVSGSTDNVPECGSSNTTHRDRATNGTSGESLAIIPGNGSSGNSSDGGLLDETLKGQILSYYSREGIL
jgi:hypothetical protein